MLQEVVFTYDSVFLFFGSTFFVVVFFLCVYGYSPPKFHNIEMKHEFVGVNACPKWSLLLARDSSFVQC